MGKSDLKSAKSNLAAGHFDWGARAARMVRTAPKHIIVRHTGPEYKRFCIQAMERSVKSVELTCNRQPTTTHDIPPVLARLPQDWEITEDLKAAWATWPGSLRVYADLSRGLNQHTGTNFNDL